MKLGFSRQNLEKYSNAKFHNILSIGSRVVACDVQKHRQRETDMTKLIVACHSFMYAPKWN